LQIVGNLASNPYLQVVSERGLTAIRGLLLSF